MKKPDHVLELTAIKPTEADGRFVSPELENELKRYSQQQMWSYYLSQEEGSIEERDAAKNLAKFYLLKNAEEQQFAGRDKGLWADRFTEAGVEIYGEIEEVIAKNATVATLPELIETPTSSDRRVEDSRQRLSAVLEEIELTNSTNLFEIASEILSEKRRKVLKESLQQGVMKQAIEIVEQVETEPPYQSVQVREIFRQIINNYSRDNALWSKWRVTDTPDKSILSVLPTKHEVDVPSGRKDIKDKEELLRLVCHEIGVHVQRSVNGETLGDEFLRIGVPEYIDFEEGLGITVEYLISGKIPDKVMDYYVEAALALGLLTGKEMSRSELIQFVIDRETLRAHRDGEQIDEKAIIEIARMNIDRVFRGGDAVQYEDNNGTSRQAVFVRGGIYLKGFLRVITYMVDRMDESYSADAIFKYLLSGKFDPTKEVHQKYVAQRSIEL